MEKTKLSTQQERDREIAQILSGTMIPVKVELFEPFVKFGKDYLAFFGNVDSFETFCMNLIYDGLNRLHRELGDFVKQKGHFTRSGEWFDEYPHMGIVSDQPEDEDS